MSLRRFTFLTTEEIVSHLPAHGHAALPERGRELPEDTGAPPSHANPGGARGQQPGADRRAHHRAGLALHAHEANRAREGCFDTLSQSIDPPSQAVKSLSWLTESAGCRIGALASLGSPALVPGPISSGFEPVSDPTISHNRGLPMRDLESMLRRLVNRADPISHCQGSQFPAGFGWSACKHDQRRERQRAGRAAA